MDSPRTRRTLEAAIARSPSATNSRFETDRRSHPGGSELSGDSDTPVPPPFAYNYR